MPAKLKNSRLVLLLLGLFLLAFSCKNGREKAPVTPVAQPAEGVLYTCPMHPEVVSDKPGRCPKCNMFLEPKDLVLEQLVADPNRIVISSQATVQVSRKALSKPVHTNGIIAFDERRNNTVSAYFPGRIEELFVNYNYTFVRKGQPILSLYSPELLTAQEEFLFVLQAGDAGLAQHARKRLRLLGLTDAQLRNLEKNSQPQTSLTVFSPYEGYLQFNPAASGGAPAMAQSTPAAGSGMSGMGSPAATPAPVAGTAPVSEAPLREGQYVTKGLALFTVNDLKKVWAILTIPAGSASGVKTGDKVEMRSQLMPERSISGKIDLVEPVVREGQNQVTVRVYLDNPDLKLKPNSLVQATITPQSHTAKLTVPRSAVWNLGTRNIVWVRKTPAGGRSYTFEATEVQVGQQTGDFTEILSGLPDSSHLAKEAGYMTDSESFIRP